jgi:hypothetical protein
VAPLTRLRRAPWLSGALLLALAGLLVAPAAWFFGVRRWPLYIGLAAALVLVFGSVENAWRSRPLRSRSRALERGRLRLVPGGKSKGKGNGHAQDLPGPPEDDGDKPRWVM